jgi:hypothetical protein
MDKSTDAEINIRHATVAEMLVKGQSRQDILQYASNTWKVSDRTADEYIAKAWAKLKKSINDDIDNYKSLLINRFEDLYKRNYNIQDYRECRQVLGDLSKIIGLSAESGGKKNNPNVTKLRSVKNF